MVQQSIQTTELRNQLLHSYETIRMMTNKLVEPLETEDYTIQSIPDVSPPKWHMAHTTWFFETFILKEYCESYRSFHEEFDYLFNSYYESVGSFFPRHSRGLLSRPSIEKVRSYRKDIDEEVIRLIIEADEKKLVDISGLIEIGLNHEQQHQELLMTDIKYNFSINPLKPVYRELEMNSDGKASPLEWVSFEGGLVETGINEEDGFSFDNERPVHKVWLEPFELATRTVTNGEYLAFIEDGGYQRAEFWLSDGWSTVKNQNWEAPLHWEKKDGEWYNFTLHGLVPVNREEPVTHISYYEAEAYASWVGKRLPTEAEWEVAVRDQPITGNFVEDGVYHPVASVKNDEGQLQKAYGDVWEWTKSPYMPYPGNKPLDGALGEYNAKFMSSQMILRGGSCVTSQSHIRPTYRNFFAPDKRWQFTGIRLAGDVE
ncbi:ergothioneine biosynthesis protein EgtB [Bacillus sp. NTK071]|uniref:ergothioneine biosynthesis protein EgtB n=1 Tax=Bacillus sp. NTK071 TaxID=2802175 RepID=UPI001A8ED895|nr:ergothioneine biosynthesis protein EgtB [Bacillus sp. NTK071]MBN8207686.1 ergothioneine biosynthesis protein EgtB [Bacillus sp. NTK071]